MKREAGASLRPQGRPGILVLALAAATAMLYLGWAWAYGEPGFPLDDGWIHQTYARNLAHHGQWAFNLGEASAGSTSPLWSLLLALGYALRIDFRLWTFALGAGMLGGTAWAAQRLTAGLFPDARRLAWMVGGFCVLEWHLAWAAFSGMETLLFAAMSLILLERWLRGGRGWDMGLAAGLLTLTRPEGILLAALVGAAMAVRGPRQGRWLGFGAGLAALLLPYLAFHWAVAGSPFPNTLYAKQAEYAILGGKALPLRLAEVAWAPLIGAQLLLAPGFAYAVMHLARRRRWAEVVPALWWAAFIGLYAWRLPVAYQHGRYLIPSIPILVAYGGWGTWRLVRRCPLPLLGRAWAISIGLLLAIFWALGAQAYASDVRIINSEMVQTARWIRQETPQEAVVAAHDIGALGYHGQRMVLDLAGLVTPEVIPFIREEDRLLEFMRLRSADYLVAFPSWYPWLASRPEMERVYEGTEPWAIEEGGDHMAVYRIRWARR